MPHRCSILSLSEIVNLDDAQALFERHVDKTTTPDGCWPWCGSVSRTGYGTLAVRIDWRWYRGLRAHRFAYLLTHKSIADPALVVRHLCHNRLCCRHDHLALGTMKDNVNDGVQAGRHAHGERHWTRLYPERLRGEDNPNSKLTTEDVQRIHMLAAQGWSQRAISTEVGCSAVNVGLILNGRKWQHVPRSS